MVLMMAGSEVFSDDFSESPTLHQPGRATQLVLGQLLTGITVVTGGTQFSPVGRMQILPEATEQDRTCVSRLSKGPVLRGVSSRDDQGAIEALRAATPRSHTSYGGRQKVVLLQDELRRALPPPKPTA